jgi:hypothetical protein
MLNSEYKYLNKWNGYHVCVHKMHGISKNIHEVVKWKIPSIHVSDLKTYKDIEPLFSWSGWRLVLSNILTSDNIMTDSKKLDILSNFSKSKILCLTIDIDLSVKEDADKLGKIQKQCRMNFETFIYQFLDQHLLHDLSKIVFEYLELI